MGSRFKLFIPLIIFVVMAFFLWRGLSIDPKHLPSALIDKPMPEFELPVLGQEKTLTKNDLVGKPFLINIWGTWCTTCYYEHPYLVELSKQGVNILGVNWRDDREAALEWLKKLENPYFHIIEDQEGRLVLDLGVTAAPETFVVDSNGMVKYRHTGQVTKEVWQRHLAPLMQ